MANDITRVYPQLKALGKYLRAAGALAEHQRPVALASLTHPALMSIACIGIPQEFNPCPTASYTDISYVHHLQIIEYLCRSDASAMMMLPGASLSTRAILTLGTPSQQARFFSCFAQRPAWTFFAVTEPERGSDATAIQCELTLQQESGWINGTKMFIGGASDASAGIVFTRHAQSQRLVMVFPEQAGEKMLRERLTTFGLNGAGLTRITFNHCPVQKYDILGHGHRGLQQGLNALSLVFERHRPMVAAMALGTTYGLLTSLENYTISASATQWITRQWRKYHSVYQSMLCVASGFASGRHQYTQTSQLKLIATQLVEETARHLPHWLHSKAWSEDHALRRKYRDSFAFEYMEGTSNIHLLTSLRPPQPV